MNIHVRIARWSAVAIVVTAATHEVSAQTVRDHRSGGGGTFTPSASPTPPPAVNAPPPTMPGEFAFQNVVSKQYLSAAGNLRIAAARGPSEKFRIVQERGTAFERIQSAANTYVYATADVAKPPVSLVASTNDGTLFSLSRTGAGSYQGAYQIALKASPTWSLQQDGDTTGLKPTVSAWNFPSNARALFWVTKCGDIGTPREYMFRPLGATTGSGTFRFIRQGDGIYAISFTNERKYWSAVGGGGNAPGKGSDGYPIEYKDSIGANEKFKIIDQGNCTYAIQTAKGWYFGMKSGGWNWESFSTRISDPNAAPTIGYVALWELMPASL
jgi:hypothetical protein